VENDCEYPGGSVFQLPPTELKFDPAKVGFLRFCNEVPSLRVTGVINSQSGGLGRKDDSPFYVSTAQPHFSTDHLRS